MSKYTPKENLDSAKDFVQRKPPRGSQTDENCPDLNVIESTDSNISMLVDINPKVLVWAREERGMLPHDVAEKLGISLVELSEFESDGKQIPFSLLEKISNLYKRQSAIFFLDIVPVKAKKPKDYRNLAVEKSNFSPEAMLAVRRAERYLNVARELHDSKYWSDQYEWLKDFSGKPGNFEKEISEIKELLELKIEERSAKTPDVFFGKLRKKFEEKLGIFVFQFPMPEDEFDGFSYAFDKFPYAIVVNNQNAPAKKIFTLFHELAHILKHDPAACKNNFENTNNSLVELECNNFAGKFLVPTRLLKFTDDVDEIFILAGKFNISGEVYLRRLHEEGMVSKESFFDLLKLVQERSSSFIRQKPEEREGGPSMIIQSKSTRGNKFFETVVIAATGGSISYSKASDLLGLKVGNIRL